MFTFIETVKIEGLVIFKVALFSDKDWTVAVGAVIVTLLITTSSALVGTAPQLQFPASFQLLLPAAPVHVHVLPLSKKGEKERKTKSVIVKIRFI